MLSILSCRAFTPGSSRFGLTTNGPLFEGPPGSGAPMRRERPAPGLFKQLAMQQLVHRLAGLRQYDDFVVPLRRCRNCGTLPVLPAMAPAFSALSTARSIENRRADALACAAKKSNGWRRPGHAIHGGWRRRAGRRRGRVWVRRTHAGCSRLKMICRLGINFVRRHPTTPYGGRDRQTLEKPGP